MKMKIKIMGTKICGIFLCAYSVLCLGILSADDISVVRAAAVQNVQNLENGKQSDEFVQTVDRDDIRYLAAWTSLAAYSDKLALISRNILVQNGWQIMIFDKNMYGDITSDIKFLLADKMNGDEQLYLLSICGTSSMQDVKTDLKVGSSVFGGSDLQQMNTIMADTELTDDKALVHSGFLQYVQDGFFTQKENGLTLGEYLAEQLQQNKKAKLYITGHSLGGAVAELLTARLLDMGVSKNQLYTVTFGAPAVGNKTFVETYEPQMNLDRITLKGDPVKNLAQIGNSRFVQFKNNTEWSVPINENDKFAHGILLYCDVAMRNYFDEQKSDDGDNDKDVDIVKVDFDFPEQFSDEKRYIVAALKDKMVYKGESVIFVDETLPMVQVLAKAEAVKAKHIVFYKFQLIPLKDSTSNKRYYVNGNKYVFDNKGNLIQGYSASTDTNDMTVIQAAMYTDYQFN